MNVFTNTAQTILNTASRGKSDRETYHKYYNIEETNKQNVVLCRSLYKLVMNTFNYKENRYNMKTIRFVYMHQCNHISKYVAGKCFRTNAGQQMVAVVHSTMMKIERR